MFSTPESSSLDGTLVGGALKIALPYFPPQVVNQIGSVKYFNCEATMGCLVFAMLANCKTLVVLKDFKSNLK